MNDSRIKMLKALLRECWWRNSLVLSFAPKRKILVKTADG